MDGETTLEQQLAESYADHLAGNPGRPWEQVRAEAERDRYRDALRALVAAAEGLSLLLTPVDRAERALAAWDAARALLGNGAGAEAAEQ